MLLIGMPYSASTSLAYTLKEILSLRYAECSDVKSENIKCTGYSNLQKYNAKMYVKQYDLLKQHVSSRNTLYKYTLLPTDDHIRKLKRIDENIVIILRDVEEIIKYYKKAFSYFTTGVKTDFNSVKLELNSFYHKYKSLKDYPRFLVIDFNDLINNYKKTINKIINHYGFEKKFDEKKYPLQKR